jgi:mono/diheme cytochrome c family protein
VQTSKRALLTAAVALPIIWFVALPAAHAGNASDGRAIAQRWCSGCHDIGSGETKTTNDLAPGFESVARRSVLTHDQLVAWIGDPHPPMPNLHLTRVEIDNLVEYIQSLKTPH